MPLRAPPGGQVRDNYQTSPTYRHHRNIARDNPNTEIGAEANLSALNRATGIVMDRARRFVGNGASSTPDGSNVEEAFPIYQEARPFSRRNDERQVDASGHATAHSSIAGTSMGMSGTHNSIRLSTTSVTPTGSRTTSTPPMSTQTSPDMATVARRTAGLRDRIRNALERRNLT
jgi:hypothetical protein